VRLDMEILRINYNL